MHACEYAAAQHGCRYVIYARRLTNNCVSIVTRLLVLEAKLSLRGYKQLKLFVLRHAVSLEYLKFCP